MKAYIVQSLRSQYPLRKLLKSIALPRATYYDRLKRNAAPDKYAQVKAFITRAFSRSHETYGYRRMHVETVKAGFLFCAETIRRIMGEMGLKVAIYSKHTSRYSSYRGEVGKAAPNLLRQQFTATQPRTVFHTDVTQVRLANGEWGYISSITDEASREVLAISVSNSPNQKLIHTSLMELKIHLNSNHASIIHSDHGWQYEMPGYIGQIQKLHLTQSMSRKGNCHDNAPIESFFGLLKRECLNRLKIQNLQELRKTVKKYASWFNNDRISMVLNGLTPREYRQQFKLSKSV